MIKCKIANQRVEVLEASGSTKTIAVEVAVLIASLYSALCKSAAGQEQSRLFRLMLNHIITAPDSPVWEPDSNIEGIFLSRPIRGGNPMNRITWKRPNGSWGINGVDLAKLPPNAYGALWKLMQLEDLMDAPATKTRQAACGKCCGHANDGTRSECADCPIMVMSVGLLATAAELDATTSSYERLKIACERRGAELTRLRREKRGGTVDAGSK